MSEDIGRLVANFGLAAIEAQLDPERYDKLYIRITQYVADLESSLREKNARIAELEKTTLTSEEAVALRDVPTTTHVPMPLYNSIVKKLENASRTSSTIAETSPPTDES